LSESLGERIGHLISSHVDAKHVYGEPVERDGVTIIPVAKMQWGFGGGAIGQGPLERGGGGGGVRATPAGFSQIRDGVAEYKPFRDAGDVIVIIGAAFAGLALGFLLTRKR
jgi:uncharacterized spore protein YtfJ